MSFAHRISPEVIKHIGNMFINCYHQGIWVWFVFSVKELKGMGENTVLTDGSRRISDAAHNVSRYRKASLREQETHTDRKTF